MQLLLANLRRGLVAASFALLVALIAALPAASNLRQTSKITPPDGAGRFGAAMAISPDGNVAVIGAPGIGFFGGGAGDAYVYVRSGASFTRAATLRATDGFALDGFGAGVAIDDGVIVVGAANAQGVPSHAYVYLEPSGGWAGTIDQAAILTPANDADATSRFGKAVAIDGNVIAVGDQKDVFVFLKPTTGWSGTLTERARLVPGSSYPCIGGSIAVRGTVIVTGEPLADFRGCKAAVYNRPLLIGWTGTITPSAILVPPTGAGTFGEVDLDGATIVVGAAGDTIGGQVLGEGAAYVFVRPGDTWSGTLDPAARLLGDHAGQLDHVGQDVDIEGDTIVVGTRSDASDGIPGDAVYVFDKPAGGWSGDLYETQRIGAAGSEAFHLFGNTVVTANGHLLIADPVDGAQVVGGVYSYFVDGDADGEVDVVDNCPDIPNHYQEDTDADGTGDACDTDNDNDGIADVADNCQAVANADQADTDADGTGDACDTDNDNDGIDDSIDNCLSAANPNQLDLDADGTGDACDTDNDNDAIDDSVDNCLSAANPDQLDLDADGTGDACDADNTVAIDVMPGLSPNAVRTAGKRVPVAILSTEAFDASTRVDQASLRFGKTGTEASLSGACRVGDVNIDGLPDLTCDFEVKRTHLRPMDETAILTGATIGTEGTDFSGSTDVTLRAVGLPRKPHKVHAR